MQELQQYFTEKLVHRELVESKEIGVEEFLDYIAERNEQEQVKSERYGEKIWGYIKRTCG